MCTQRLSHGTKQKCNEETETKTEMLRRNSPVMRSVESVLGLEGSLWCERFVKEIGFKPGVKERETWYGW